MNERHHHEKWSRAAHWNELSMGGGGVGVGRERGGWKSKIGVFLYGCDSLIPLDAL